MKVYVATTSEASAAVFLGWWSLPFRYVAKMVTIEGEKPPAFHTIRVARRALHFAVLVSVNGSTKIRELRHSMHVCNISPDVQKN